MWAHFHLQFTCALKAKVDSAARVVSRMVTSRTSFPSLVRPNMAAKGQFRPIYSFVDQLVGKPGMIFINQSQKAVQ